MKTPRVKSSVKSSYVNKLHTSLVTALSKVRDPYISASQDHRVQFSLKTQRTSYNVYWEVGGNQRTQKKPTCTLKAWTDHIPNLGLNHLLSCKLVTLCQYATLTRQSANSIQCSKFTIRSEIILERNNNHSGPNRVVAQPLTEFLSLNIISKNKGDCYQFIYFTNITSTWKDLCGGKSSFSSWRQQLNSG